MSYKKIEIKNLKNCLKISLNGSIDYKDAKEFRKISAINDKNINKKVIVDFTNLESLDYSIAILLNDFKTKMGANFENLRPNFNEIFKLLEDEKIVKNYKIEHFEPNLLEKLGFFTVKNLKGYLIFSSFLGEVIIKGLKAILNPANFRLKELSNYIKDGGVNAIFIVSLTAFLIGVVLAYLGSALLTQFGASIYIVDIMGVLTLREVAPLIAAIVIAGRSASSFAAQIGVMKINEEIDAMRTMGLDPLGILVFPRVMAMIISVPLVVFLADAISIFGQMLVSDNILDIGYAQYLSRFKDSIDLSHFWVGMVKAPFFGALIALIGCFRGFEVSQNAQSLGEKTTISVVNAIFFVIAIDAIFAIFFMWYGI